MCRQVVLQIFGQTKTFSENPGWRWKPDGNCGVRELKSRVVNLSRFSKIRIGKRFIIISTPKVMGLFDKLFKKNNNLTAHTNDVSMDEMAKIQDALRDKMDEQTYNNRFNQACRLVPKGQYAEALVEFEAIKIATPDQSVKGTCDNQIGVCHFFLGDYQRAIEAYTSSIENGFDAGMAQDNIWEAYEVLYKQSKNPAYMANYLQQFPSGNYAKKAEKILNA